MIKTNQALTYIDDTILQSQNKAEMFEIIPKYHALVRTAGLKVSLEKTFFFLQQVNFLRTHSLEQGDTTYCQKSPRFKNLKTPENKRDVMGVIGSFGWYIHYIKNLRVNCKPLYELTHDITPFHWTNEQ